MPVKHLADSPVMFNHKNYMLSTDLDKVLKKWKRITLWFFSEMNDLKMEG